MSKLYRFIRSRIGMRRYLVELGVVSEYRVRGNFVCVLHDDKQASARVYDDEIYHCFGCGAHLDIIDLDVRLRGGDRYQAALRLLRDFRLVYDQTEVVVSGRVNLNIFRNREWENLLNGRLGWVGGVYVGGGVIGERVKLC